MKRTITYFIRITEQNVGLPPTWHRCFLQFYQKSNSNVRVFVLKRGSLIENALKNRFFLLVEGVGAGSGGVGAGSGGAVATSPERGGITKKINWFKKLIFKY